MFVRLLVYTQELDTTNINIANSTHTRKDRNIQLSGVTVPACNSNILFCVLRKGVVTYAMVELYQKEHVDYQ